MKKINLKNLIFSIIFFLITVASFFLTLRQINIFHNEFLNLTNIYKEQQSKSNQTKALNKVLAEIGTEVDILNSHFLDIANLASFLDELELNAKKIGVSIEVVAVDNPTKENNSLLLNLKAEGNFEAINDFLLMLENYKYELEITDFTLNADSVNDIKSLPNWVATFKIKVISFVN